MTVKKLKPAKVDVIFLDPVTMEKVCSLNECIEKFTLTGIVLETSYPRWLHGEALVRDCHYHECNQCHRKYKSPSDVKKNIASFYSAAAGNKPIGPK